MGSGKWDSTLYSSTSHAASAKLASNSATVGSLLLKSAKKMDKAYYDGLVSNGNKVDPKLLEKGVREARDSADHPLSTPIIVAADVTGSMGFVSEEIVRSGLGTLFNRFYDEKPVTDPQVLFMAFDDVECGVDVPLQVSQFESDNRIVQQLADVYLTGHGGGNSHESYHLPWYIAGHHTSTDSFEKRGKKGYLFTVGDECPPERLTREEIMRATGETCEKDVYTARELLETAREKYHVFHIVAKEGSYARSNFPLVEQRWSALIGQDLIIMEDHKQLGNIIVDVIEQNEAEIKASEAASPSAASPSAAAVLIGD